MFISLFSWIIGEKPQWFFRIWNSTHIAHLRVIPKSFLCHFSESASTKHWKPSSLYAFKRNRAIVFQRETFPQLLLSSGNSLRSRIHPDSLLLGLQGVFEAHHLLETVPSFPLLHRVCKPLQMQSDPGNKGVFSLCICSKLPMHLPFSISSMSGAHILPIAHLERFTFCVIKSSMLLQWRVMVYYFLTVKITIA